MRAAIRKHLTDAPARRLHVANARARTLAGVSALSHTRTHTLTHTHARTLPTVALRTDGARASSTSTPAEACARKDAPLPPPVEHPSFKVLHHARIPELSVCATLYSHTHTRGEVLSIISEDEEKVFGICFRTPPPDDSGVPHILEHSVLCGSRKYPLKEPFVALLKSSTHTYLNAMTYSDRTVYPVASPNLKDFYNLVDVYLDAVFHPRLQPWVLQQEGWHYEVEAAGAAQEGQDAAREGATGAQLPPPGARKLSYKGVVFNEMKGVFSSPDSVRAYAEERALFAAHAYARNSGGDPLAIPSLTFDSFSEFHRKFYHPSNARAFFFGDDDPKRRLDIMHEYFSNFAHNEAAIVESEIKYQPLMKQPQRVLVPVPAEADELVGSEPATDGVEPAEPTSDAREPLSPAGVAAHEASVEEHAAVGTAVDPHAPADARARMGLDEEIIVDYSVGAAGAISVAPRPAGVPAVVQPELATSVPAEARQGELARKHALSVNWVLNDGKLDDLTRMGLGVLSHLLMSTQVATLYKALTDSALGSAVIGGGVDSSMIHTTFSAGLKGVHVDNVDAVEKVIIETLERAAREGFTKEHLDAAFNTIEFGLREFAGGGGPRGLALFLSAVPGWIYGRDPLHELHFEEPLNQLKSAVAADPDFFQRLIRKYLLDNKHRVTVHAYPDPGFNARRDAQERAALDATAAGMSEDDWKKVAAAAEELKIRQATPDPPEAVATIPTLQLSDLPRQSKPLPKAVKYLPPPSARPSSVQEACGDSATGAEPQPASASTPHTSRTFRGLLTAVDAVRHALPESWHATASQAPPSTPVHHAREPVIEKHGALHHGHAIDGELGCDVEFLQHVLPANGIAYTSAYFDLSPMPQRLLPYLPLFAWASTSCGTERTDEVTMSHLLGTHTGGVGVAASVTDVPGSRAHAFPYLVLGGKALNGSVGRMGDLGVELLLSARLDRKDRIAHYLRSTIARHEAGIVSSGHRYAGSVLSALYTKAGWVSETLGGISQLYTARTLLHRLETGADGGFDGIVADLHEIRNHILRRDNVLFSATADETGMAQVEPMFQRLLESLDSRNPPQPPPSTGPAKRPFRLMSAGGALPRLASGWTWIGGAAHNTAPHERDFPLSPIPSGLHKNATVPGCVGIVVPTQVNYVAKAAPAYAMGSVAPGSAEVMTNLLRTGYLWEKVRVQGGAYGAFCGLNRHAGILSFGSYRDPNLGATLDVFDGTSTHLRGAAAEADRSRLEDDIRKAIISTVGGLDAPMSPEEKGERSTARHLSGVTEAHVQQRREQILDTNVKDLLAFSNAADTVAREGHVVVVASEEAFAEYHKDTSKPMFELLRPLQSAPRRS